MSDVVQGDLGVLGALLRRRAECSTPLHRSDGLTVALVVEGGGMRGAYAGGMLHALERLGLRDAFDVVYGTSAGAFTASSFLTRQAWGAARIFYEDLASREFIDYRRPPTGRGPLVSLDYLIEEVLAGPKPMDWHALITSDIPLHVVATRLPDLRPHSLGGYGDAADWQLALRASACIPVLAGPPVQLEGTEWLDGSVTEPLAVQRALDDGATQVLVLLSRATPEVPEYDEGESVPAWRGLLEQLRPGLWRAVAERPRRYSELMRTVNGRPGVCGIRPGASAGIRALTIDSARLRAASAAGAAAVLDAVAEWERS